MTAAKSFYTPDPSAETTYVIESFLSALQSIVPEEARTGVHNIPQRLSGLVQQYANWATDQPSTHNLRYACAVLAAFEALSPHLAPDHTLTILREAFGASGAAVREKTRAALDKSPDAFRDLVAVSKAREVVQFGPQFIFERERDDDQAYLLNVRKCFWHDFFGAIGHPELTTVLCAFDRNWFEAIDPERHGVRFERTTTLGEGGDHCPFHFFRQAAGEPEQSGATGRGPRKSGRGGFAEKTGDTAREFAPLSLRGTILSEVLALLKSAAAEMSRAGDKGSMMRRT